MTSFIEYADRLASDIDVLINGILGFLPEMPTAIFLCGGYGRDEGAWFLQDGKPTPYNDYDIAIIVNDVPDAEKTNELRKKLASQIGISWVDIDYYKPEYFDNLKPTIKNYDLLNGSKLIYGQFDLSNLKGSFKTEEIGEYDLMILYQTRIWTFLGSWDGNFHDLSVDEARFFRNQMAKAALAAVDMVLIKHHQYVSSYVERVKRACSLYSAEEMFCEMIRWAIHEKMNPSSSLMYTHEMIKLYFDIKKVFKWAFTEGMGKKADYFLNPRKTKAYYIFNRQYHLRVIYSRIFNPNYKFQKMTDVFLAENYIFHAIDESETVNSYMTKANNILRHWNYIDRDITDIHELRQVAAMARNNI